MWGSYTQEASDVIFDLMDRELAAIWEDIEATPQDTTAELWKKKLTKIARSFGYSGRFCLMRLMGSRALGREIAEGEDFELWIQDERYVFRDVSMTHAENLSVQEHMQYIDCLMALADLQADSDPQVNRAAICRAWFDVESADLVAESLLPPEILADEKRLKAARSAYAKENKQYKNRLTKEEIFRLGHILDFSLGEMQWFLLRALDVAEGFRFNQSEDLIEAYGFLTGKSWQKVQALKECYQASAAGIEKTEPVGDGSWTQDVSDSLLGKVEVWKLRPETMDDNFMEWLLAQAPGLDAPSRTAGRIYRNLAAFAHDLITGEEIVPAEEEFADCIQDVCEERSDSGAAVRLLYQAGKLSPQCCKEAADALLLENKIQAVSIQEDNTKAWHVLSTLSDGALTAAGGVVNTGRSRVADILAGKVQAEKSDMLYLLWFTANLIWQSNDIPDTNAICCRVIDFMDTAKLMLEAALLPGFYPPHPVEQSMLLSIVGGRSEEDAPSVVYEYMLQTLTRQRQRKQGSKRHDMAFKIEVITHYRSHPELSLEDCAAQFGIAPQTLSAWQKKLIEDGLVE